MVTNLIRHRRAMDTGDARSVLVTGGRGFIGRATVKVLRRAGYKVVSLDAKASVIASEDEDEIVCDLTEAKQVQQVFQARSITRILHLAAILPTAAQRAPERATQVNVEASLHLLEMARRFGVPRFVFGSSLSIYGTWPADRDSRLRSR